MPLYHVPVKYITTTTYLIEATDKYEAMQIAEDESDDELILSIVDESESDPEAHYSDIIEVTK